MNINGSTFDVLQRCFAIALKNSDTFDEGCKTISLISRICQNWRTIIYTRIEPIKTLYDRFFMTPLVLTKRQSLSDIHENTCRSHLYHRISIGFYHHLNPESRLFRHSEQSLEPKFVPIINNENMYECNIEETGLETSLSQTEIKNNLAQILINSGDLACLETVLNSGVSVDNPYRLIDKEYEDVYIDATLDLFLLACKKLVFNRGVSDSRTFKQILLLMKDPRFLKHQRSNFFEFLRSICFESPDTFSLIELWKLIEESNPINLMLNLRKFLCFLLKCESRDDYTNDQLNELNVFIRDFINRINLSNVRFLEESVHHPFFPIVLENIANRWDWYHNLFFVCLKKNKEINLKNALHLLEVIKSEHEKDREYLKKINGGIESPFESPYDRYLPENYFYLALKDNWKIALLFIGDKYANLVINPSDLKKCCKDLMPEIGINGVIEILDKLIESPQITRKRKIAYERVRKEFKEQNSKVIFYPRQHLADNSQYEEYLSDQEMMDSEASFDCDDIEEPPTKRARKK